MLKGIDPVYAPALDATSQFAPGSDRSARRSLWSKRAEVRNTQPTAAGSAGTERASTTRRTGGGVRGLDGGARCARVGALRWQAERG